MQAMIKTLPEKKLVGKSLKMSFSRDRTAELWQFLMPRRNEINNVTGSALYSVEIYSPDFFKDFNPGAEFEKWAAIEVSDYDHIPAGFRALLIPRGLYAVFIHKGPASNGRETYNYIFRTWLPASGFVLDNRPHFALMGEKYRHEDPGSEEEIWIPLK